MSEYIDIKQEKNKLKIKLKNKKELMNKIAILSRNNTPESRKKVEELKKDIKDL